MVKLLNSTEYAGETVEFTLDNMTYPVTLVTNGTHTIGKLAVQGAGVGQHTMSLSDPAGCFDPVVFVCPVNSGSADAEFDALWAEYELGGYQSSVQSIPGETKLLGNYPNPFNPTTTMRYTLAEQGEVSLRVYNTLGQLVKTIVNGFQTSGYHEATWDGTNESGAVVASGIYVYRLATQNLVETKRMILMK
jgi:hypothetical protein